jgi:hypothetical protein
LATVNPDTDIREAPEVFTMKAGRLTSLNCLEILRGFALANTQKGKDA